jgi:hypothetical protein
LLSIYSIQVHERQHPNAASNIHLEAMLLSPSISITNALKTSIPSSKFRLLAVMSAPNSNGQTLWSSIAKDKNYSGGSRTFASEQQQTSNSNQQPKSNAHHNKRTTSPSHNPQTSQAEKAVYILTLQTDEAHHARMTALRAKYFPKHLNKLEAHLTFFHALPESRLDSDVLPALQSVAHSTQPFDIEASHPFRMKKGFGITVPEGKGGRKAREVRAGLLGVWQDGESSWLSEQDSGTGYRAHYTVMNKVDDEGVVQKALREVESGWKEDRGRAVGLGLWRYERGYWKWVQGFEFGSGESR